MATGMLRPISRYYDENEHKYPQELDIVSFDKDHEPAEKKEGRRRN